MVNLLQLEFYFIFKIMSFSGTFDALNQKLALLVSPLIRITEDDYCLAVVYTHTVGIVLNVMLLEENYTMNLSNGSLLEK